MRWSVEEHGYQAFCPFCGEPLMLCDECRHAGGKSCNYSEGTKSCILGSSTRYPELTGYRDHRLYLPAETTGEEEKWLGCYQIIFEADGERYYCSVDAEDLTEALGRFFMEHPHITYDLVVDHTEAGTSRPPCTNGGSA